MSKLGIARERQVRALLVNDGWWVARAAGSFGDADLVACRARSDTFNAPPEVRLIEVKATAAGPYSGFGPKDRAELIAAAKKAGAEAWLCWWPSRKKPQWLASWDWPS